MRAIATVVWRRLTKSKTIFSSFTLHFTLISAQTFAVFLSANNMVWHFITTWSFCTSKYVCIRPLSKETAHLWTSQSLALSHVVRIERQMDNGAWGGDGRWYQLTQGLPLASGNKAGANGPSSVLAEGIVSESSSTGDYHSLFTLAVIQQLILSQPTNPAHSVCVCAYVTQPGQFWCRCQVVSIFKLSYSVCVSWFSICPCTCGALKLNNAA